MSQKTQDKMSEIDEHIGKRFDIRKRLGKGAYGIVWKATDKKTGQTFAVKKIFDAFRNQTDSQRTFREIMFLQAFRNHPNIIHLHSVHRAANNRDIYLAFEYMDIDLHVVIKRGNILRDCHHRYIMYQLFNATSYIHSGNVIHRDQKPSNVLLDHHCRCKIADFGLARSITPSSNDGAVSNCGDSDYDPNLTDYVATRWYRAPEILIASKRYTKGIDMWSLGCILGEMLAGKPIFPGTSTVNQVEKIMSTIPAPTPDDITSICSGIGTSMIKNGTNANIKTSVSTILGPDCPVEALDLVNKLLIFNPNKRLTADQALDHRFVSTYRNKKAELSLDKNVVPPLNDDTRLSIDEYRNKLYEYMSSPPGSKSSKPCTRRSSTSTNKSMDSGTMDHRKPEIIKVRTSPMPVRDISYRPIANLLKEKPNVVHSEMKFRPDPRQKLSSISFKSESRLSTAPIKSTNVMYANLPKHISQQQYHHRSSLGDLKVTDLKGKLSSDSSDIGSKEKPRKKILNVKTSYVYSSPYNSYSQNHGIITASALRELKSGVR